VRCEGAARELSAYVERLQRLALFRASVPVCSAFSALPCSGLQCLWSARCESRACLPAEALRAATELCTLVLHSITSFDKGAIRPATCVVAAIGQHRR
jgi:hypothetical protein